MKFSYLVDLPWSSLLYTLFDPCLGVEKKTFKESMHFHYHNLWPITQLIGRRGSFRPVIILYRYMHYISRGNDIIYPRNLIKELSFKSDICFSKIRASSAF